MKFPLSWLKDYIDLDVSVDELCDKMTMLGLEIESVESMGEGIQNVVVGHILDIQPHPDADKLVICQTEVGQDEPLQIVCGAKNMKAGDKVPTAVPGGSLPGGFKIGKRKMRGVESAGMMCSAQELGLGEDHSGLLILDTDAPVGQDVRSILGLDDVILEIEVTPNRNDWSGLIGIARELSAAYGTPLKIPQVSLTEGDTLASDLSSVTIEAPNLCNRYLGRIIQGVKVGPSPDWLAQRLIAAGQRPINNIVDITNYVLLETGHPLHAFDLNKLNGKRVVVRQAKPGETMKTLDQEDRKLTEDMLVIADAQIPIAIAGIMGGADSEVGDDTVDLFIESAYFSPSSVRKTARTLGLNSEASQRFQRGADPDIVPLAADRVCELILECAGGELTSGTLGEYPKPIIIEPITLNFHRVEKVLGTNVSSETQLNILKTLGFSVTEPSEDDAIIHVPPRRHDATREADLIEEIARLFGFENIEPTLPRVRPVEARYAPSFQRHRDLRNHILSCGLTEFFNWTFTNRPDMEKAGLTKDIDTLILLENPLSEKQEGMRTSLLPGLLNTASFNLRKNRKSLSAFELGPVYTSSPNQENGLQHNELGIVLSGSAGEKFWGNPQHLLDIFDLKGIVEGIMANLSMDDFTISAAQRDSFADGACAEISLKGNVIGIMGQINLDVAQNFEIEHPIFIAILDTDKLLKSKQSTVVYQGTSDHPPSLRDLAVLVNDDIPAGDLIRAAQKAGGKNLAQVSIFDIYRGKQVEQGKKSVALSLIFQSKERTLTDKDTDKACNKIVKSMEHQFGAQLR
ncbi:MAG: phenylalanine--tRNA ligase subunit beta [Candidatus Hydrogenedentota bacterium]|nr:MAG: phenylalanine--tRNA ligase subunit beta [Candidatus Hydrogenedentota bacterium]